MPARCTLIVAVACFALPSAARAADPLHTRIDKHIDTGFGDLKKHAAPRAGDEEFLRRVYLDLTGTTPATAELYRFLADSAGDKRTKLIDELLAGPGYARRMAWHFDVMLMERRPDSKVPRPAWEAYLRTAFADNKPYNALVREVLASDGSDPKVRAAAKFLLDRDLEPHLVTRDIARVFLGRNVQCAQCHDHPTISDYKQADYYGIQAYLSRSFLFPNAQAPTAVIAEKAEGDVTFMSVFDKNKTLNSTRPRMPGGKPADEPKVEKGKEYKVAPAANVKPEPAYSRRARLADAVTGADNPAFARNAVNRVWALMMGRGLVHPLDMDHGDNPPSHPELLDELAAAFVSHGYDLKWLVREIALSDAYQRSSETPAGLDDPPAEKYLVAVLKPLTPEQFAYAVMQATGHTDAERAALSKLGPKATEEALDARLAARLAPFRNVLGRGGEAGADTFSSTLDQTLFLKYGGAVRGLLPPRAGNLADRLGKITNPDAAADELFAAVLARRPTADERKDVADALRGTKDRQTTINELVWALVASAEFRFNH
ncbi:DUF1549 domain-containing protein [Frigoriglobus tundricola]|uniref:DUF1553 domain-containing protein n=1 Tax=Frigoriglobus tundricola TaxID=2774151 RepID=A0A6M5YXV5_9BACT|nr:DUF1549 domain-containing protein [Frigoriglobus tundricola]QJW97792.1 hypothetical protein FTUN_5372 [Frigoriglobus tundricola]